MVYRTLNFNLGCNGSFATEVNHFKAEKLFLMNVGYKDRLGLV